MALAAFPGLAADGPGAWSLAYDPTVRQVGFAASEIRRACAARQRGLVELPPDKLADGAPVRLIISAGPADSERVARSLEIPVPPTPSSGEAYSIRRVVRDGRTTLAVLAAGTAGAMYGGLDLAEAIRLGTIEELRDADHSPHIGRRGIKFNVPLDVRTPSYSDNSHAAQNNIPEMWSFDFWREFLDEMARHRYNVLTLWNLHPFPSLVKVPEFPEVALDDVKRTRVPMDHTYSTKGNDMVRPELLQNMETVRKLTIDQKIQFWRDVMQYAADRGIDVYLFTWNIFTWGAEGKYGITSAQDNLATIDYFRKSVRETVLTYPLLAGIGITAGEHMEVRKDEFSQEKWLWKTYGEGVRDALKQQPGRQFRLIHRYHETALGPILSEWKDFPGLFDLSYKYSVAHMYSSPTPPFAREALAEIPANLRMWMTVRNDDIYSFRWGDPAYVRAYIRNLPGPDKLAGFYMGPDGYIWGREFISTEPEVPRELVIRKQWYSFMLWGRLSYDPSLPDQLFQRSLAARFPEVPADALFSAWSEASKIIPQITRFFWGDIDVLWFPEACWSHPRGAGFYTVRNFIEGKTMPGSGILNLVEWRRLKLAGEPLAADGPLEVADALERQAAAVLKALPGLRGAQGSNKELRLTLGDLAAMAHLGDYYAAKIRGAADLALFDKTAAVEQRASAVRHLQTALEHWKNYAAAYTLQYEQPRLYNRVGLVDIPRLTEKVELDITMARQWAPGTVPDKPGRR